MIVKPKNLLLIVMSILLGCSRDQEYLTISGVALNYDTQKAEADRKITIELGDEFQISDFTLTNVKTQSTVTDNKGNFKFVFADESRKLYRLQMADGYVIANEPPVLATIIDNRSSIVDTLYIGKSAGLRLIIKNDDPNDGDSYAFSIAYKNPYSSGLLPMIYSTSQIIAQMRKDPNDYQLENHFIYGLNPEVTVNFTLTKGDITTTSSTNVKLVEQMTTDHLIEF